MCHCLKGNTYQEHFAASNLDCFSFAWMYDGLNPETNAYLKMSSMFCTAFRGICRHAGSACISGALRQRARHVESKPGVVGVIETENGLTCKASCCRGTDGLCAGKTASLACMMSHTGTKKNAQQTDFHKQYVAVSLPACNVTIL